MPETTDVMEASTGAVEEASTRILSFPAPDEDMREVRLPVRHVTLLEDRAQVRRQGRVTLGQGRNRLMIRDVAPVLQDVSLRGEAGDGAHVVDVRARRAYRVRAADKPELAREIETEVERLERRFAELGEDRDHARQRYGVVLDMLSKGVAEIPEDASWGLVNHQVWHDTFETLATRAQRLLDRNVEDYFTQLDLIDDLERLASRRQAFDRWDMHFVAWIEVDVEVAEPGETDLEVEYVVPNALWRPFHTAQLLADDALRFSTAAAVWQNTGEDWVDVRLSFSTARSSLGTEPPRLTDDMLAAQRKADRVVVEKRQVAVQTSGLGREKGARAQAPSAFDLPGVDDGGEIQNLEARATSSVPSDGRLNVIPIFELETPAECRLVCVPELEQKVFLAATAANEAARSILAGPVELVREGGVVGWSRVLFIAPGERFELSFGHDDGIRVYRTTRSDATTDAVDKWMRRTTRVTIYLSNLEGQAKHIEVLERIPVSEIEHVRVGLIEEECEPVRPEIDDKGFCRWKLTIPGNERTALKLVWELATAPGVEGL